MHYRGEYLDKIGPVTLNTFPNREEPLTPPLRIYTPTLRAPPHREKLTPPHNIKKGEESLAKF